MLARLGIGARLFLAFLAIATLSLSSGVVGWLILRQISSAQTRINAEALPSITAAQRTADASARLVAASPWLAALATEEERLVQEKEVRRLSDELRSLTADAQRTAADPAARAELALAVSSLTSSLSRQSALVKERIGLARDFDARAERTIAAAAAIVDLSETLVSNASSGASAVVASLYGLIEEPGLRETAFEALDRLIEEDIYLLGRMFELRLRSSQIGLLTHRLTRTQTVEEGEAITREFERHLVVVARRIRSIDDPVRREQAAAQLEILQQATGEIPSAQTLFSLRARLLAITAELEQLARDDQELSARLNKVVEGMLQESQTFALATAGQAERAVSAGLYALVGTSLAAILLSGLIVWLYVERNLVRRLVGLTGAMRRLADGDLSVSVAVAEDGSDELKGMAKAVRVFRDESGRRRALEVERERTNEELRRHREELQQLVAEQTVRLTDTNRRLQDEVVRHTEARERAESASRAKSEFLAAMSHEIRTPMTGMLGMVRVLSATDLDEAQRRHLGVVASSGEALLGILNSILDYSKIELGRIAAEPEDFDLAQMLEGVTQLMETTAREKGLMLRLEVDPALRGMIRADVGKLRQIVFNLVSNAVKFTGRGGVVVRARLTPANGTGRRALIEVEDTGPGIGPGHRERIFEAFTQLDASVTRQFGGTGLGLAISRRLAHALGGTITVDSMLGEGSTFRLDVPLGETEAAVSARLPLPRLATPAGGAPVDVLVVEDDEPTRMVVTAFLERLGCSARLAATGFAAIDAARAKAPDAVLMDLSLPGMDGIETTRRLREEAGNAALPVIAMSAHVFRTDIERTLAAGMDAFVAKPIDLEELAAALRRALGGEGSGAGTIAVAKVDHRGPPPDADATILRADVAVLGEAGVRDLLDLAERKIGERLAAMEHACRTGDAGELARLAHQIASAAGSAGFLRLSDEARTIERETRLAPADAMLGRVAQCRRLLELAVEEASRTVPRAGAPHAGATVAANR